MDPFTTLGLPARYALDHEELERRYRDLQRALHPDRFSQAPANERRMAMSKAIDVNAAYRTLRDDLKRAEALVSVRCGPPVQESADPELLMTIMELREALSEAKAARNLDAVRKLAAQVTASQQQAQAHFAQVIDGDSPDVTRVQRALSELKYYRRFLDEVAVIEDEALTSSSPAKEHG